MSRKHLMHILSAVVTVALFVTGCSPKQHELVVAKVGDAPVTMKEYEDLYIKSNGSRETSASSTLEEREKFLDLVTKFKLKLADAYSQGLNTRPELQDEINQYKSSLASSFLTERELTAPGTKQMYERRRNEYRASHILLALNTATTHNDTLAVYAKADSIIAQLRAGASFETLAVHYSQDPSAAQNHGDLYYFTAGQMVPPFEDAVFSMKKGEITQKPVLTQFGLHIIKVVDVKPARGEIHASHIMIRFDRPDPSPVDTLAAYLKIKAIQDSLKMGMDFAELARRNSGDPGSAPKGGDLGTFTRRRWIQSFDEVVQTLKPGEVSDIVRTVYGYHIIKCLEEHPPKTFEEAKKEVQQLYQQTRYQDDYKAYFAKLQKQTQYALHEAVLRQFIAACDTNKTTRDSAWWSGIPQSIRTSAIITFGTRPVSVDSVITLINGRPEFNNTPLRDQGIRNMVEKIAESLVFSTRAETLEKDSPEFAAIMKEYTDGILLYQIEQDRVWNKVAVNDSVLKVYFNNNREKFVYPDRVDFTEVRAADDSAAQWIYSQARSGKKLEEIAAADSARMATTSNFQLEFKSGSAATSATITKKLASITQQLKADPALRLQVVTRPDTSARKSENLKIADQRIGAIRAYFKKQGIADARIVAQTQGYNKTTQVKSQPEAGEFNNRVTIDIVGRRAMVVGRPETSILPITTDERTAKVDSLQPGEVSAPFRSKFGISIVRLNKRDPARQKTFEEAGTEVSGSFQEYESKRLENDWISGLRKRFPVVEYKETLKEAFAPEH